MSKTNKIAFRERVKLKRQRTKSTFLDPDNPDSFVESLTDTFAEYLEEGNPVSVVCDLVGISTYVFRNWIRRGELYESDVLIGRHIAADERFYRFLLKVRKAEALWKRERVIRLGIKKTPYWQRDLALLERRDRMNWGKDVKEVRPDEYDPDESFL